MPNEIDAMRAAGMSVRTSPDLDAYASGQIDASAIRCALCGHAPCDCPPFGSPAYLALVAQVHGKPGAPRTYTAPEVYTHGAREGWGEAETHPERIDWTARQARAVIPFEVRDGRPVNPGESTGIRYGRNELGFWGECVCADALVTLTDSRGRRRLLLIERGDGHGWGTPGGKVDRTDLDPVAAAWRELAEETGLRDQGWTATAWPARYVPDPRASDEAWMVTVPVAIDLRGGWPVDDLPAVEGADDAARAVWALADDYPTLVEWLAERHGGEVFPAHREMLAELLGYASERYDAIGMDGPDERLVMDWQIHQDHAEGWEPEA